MIPFNKYYDQTIKEKRVDIDYDEDGNEIEANRDTVIPKKEISNKGDFVVRNGKMLFNRVGPVNGQVQTNSKAPERRGVWAFPFPIFDYFFVSSEYSHPAQMAPKEANKKKLNQAEKAELQKVANQKIEDIKKVKGSVPNFKEIEKTHPKVHNQIIDLMADVEDINKMIKTTEPIRLYTYYRLLGKENEYSNVEKEQPKAQLSDAERKELEQIKKNVIRAMEGLKPKLTPNDDNVENKYHMINSKYENLEYRLSDINELLSGEGSDTLKHAVLHGPKFNKVKKFWYNGPIYARFNDNGEIVGSGGNGEWHKFDNVGKYLEAARKWIISNSDAKKSSWGWQGKDGEKPPMIKGVIRGMGQGDHRISIDHMEVFIPL